MYYSSEGEYPNNLKVGDPIESSDGAVYMPRFPKAPSTVESGCESSEYHYEQKEAGASYEISFCLGSKIGDLEAGGITASPGGITPPPPLQCSELTTLADCQGSCYYEGEEYPVVKIEGQYINQCWMAKNLAYLPDVNNDSSPVDPKYYVYGYDGTNVATAKNSPNYSTYGVLYNYPAALTACPDGWHLPSGNSDSVDGDWDILTKNLGGNSVAGEKMKEQGTDHWVGSGIGVTNSSGFTALPAGFRSDNGSFDHLSQFAYFWSASSITMGESSYGRLCVLAYLWV